MLKNIESIVKLQIPAGKATPAPPVGPALGQHRVNIVEFCKKFNESTKSMKLGLIVPVVIKVYSDRSFDYMIKSPPVSILIKEELGIDKGSDSSNSRKVGSLSYIQLKKIAIIKMNDLTASNLQSAINCIKGTAKSMGIDIEKNLN
ncbi:50S ribosomal protein L11 [Candidatus Legionella polyplacis]|uniref:Large ribosomal subunit protein uL11 n=1 Tax=Candidatus Legionella polyplacis TaxID=2005262 RepID=A0ABZ2H0W0_9GAMM